ncbi:MAG: V-type ATP synthase subunit D [Candidatus Thermoplasmatota archaeon]|nr:V-type ATP synthase subunit D [Candidatus Thermoplasmatota archaeon]
MPKQDVKPTRTELIEMKRKIALSQRGYKLLKMKRDGLIMEFFKTLSKAKDVRAKMTQDYVLAEDRLVVAKCVEGEAVVNSAAFAIGHNPSVTMGTKNVMGVVVPTKIESETAKRRVDQKGYGVVGMSARINEAANAYEQLVEDIILAAELETTLKRLVDEIEKTKRRVNALEFKVMPELQESESFIRLRLEEMERENVFRLKKIKTKGQKARKRPVT